MITVDELTRRHARLTLARLEAWVERGLLRPVDVQGAAQGGDLCCGFTPVDAARVALLYELSEELSIDDDALDTVVDLIDQIHGLRHQLACLARAISLQSEDVQRAIGAAVKAAQSGN